MSLFIILLAAPSENIFQKGMDIKTFCCRLLVLMFLVFSFDPHLWIFSVLMFYRAMEYTKFFDMFG